MASPTDLIAKLFLRYTPLFSGLRRIPVVGRFVRWASGRVMPRDARAWVQIQRGPAQGLWLRLNPRTGGNYFEGGSEPEVQAAMQRHLRPGMTFYDVGANIGFFSLLAARMVGQEGHVVAFEADPEVAQRLREHVERNHFSTISVEQKAVWSKSHAVFFARTDPETSPDRGLGHVVGEGEAGAIRVQAIALDDFAGTSRAADFLKCDVEGAEVEVLAGARRLLQEMRPIVLCEIHSEENRRVLLDEFAKLGYHCEPLDQTHILALKK